MSLKIFRQNVPTVMILSFRTDMPGKTVQTQIRHWPSLIRFYTVCHSVCIVWTHYSMVEPHSWNFRVITTNFWVSEYLGNLRYLNTITSACAEENIIRITRVAVSLCNIFSYVFSYHPYPRTVTVRTWWNISKRKYNLKGCRCQHFWHTHYHSFMWTNNK